MGDPAPYDRRPLPSVGSIEHFDVPNYHLFLTAGEHAVI
jgi:hypothetical protein